MTLESLTVSELVEELKSSFLSLLVESYQNLLEMVGLRKDRSLMGPMSPGQEKLGQSFVQEMEVQGE